MEAEVARRRVSTLAGHFVAGDDIPATTHQHILPMNCSGSLNSGIRRYDNRVMFARQASSAQACFMRPASSTDQAMKCSGPERSCSEYRVPLFSRPTRVEPSSSRMAMVQPVAKGCSLALPEPPPRFARPNRRLTGPKRLTSKKASPPAANGIKWSPRMDVAESGQGFVLTMEIPGVSAKDIRVEVNDRNLVVMGKRSVQSWKLAGFSSNSISSYHKREILQGPYQVVWPLPNGVNKDRVSAEFLWILCKSVTSSC